jgi:hypothetical protein
LVNKKGVILALHSSKSLASFQQTLIAKIRPVQQLHALYAILSRGLTGWRILLINMLKEIPLNNNILFLYRNYSFTIWTLW